MPGLVHGEVVSADALTRSAPENQGVPSGALIAFIEAAEAAGHELHSFMLLRHGQMVVEAWWDPYRADTPHMLFSLSKSFASTAAGLAIAEGRLSLDDTVLSFFPDEAPADISDNLRAMRVRHLLSMATGHDRDTSGEMRKLGGDNWVRGFFQCPVEHAPGAHFAYNNGATYIVSAIVQKVTGERLLDYLTPRLLQPLGIKGATWEACPRGIDCGAWGLNIKTEDIARFGQLYLQQGVWNGTRLLTEDWVREATSKQVSNGDKPDSDWNQGYGFQFWRCRHGAYRGDGAFGQYCMVMPEQDAVVAITSAVRDMQVLLNLVWEHLLPAFGQEALPANSAAEGALRSKVSSLAVPIPEGEASSPHAARISGRVYKFEPNEQGYETVRFDFDQEHCLILIRNAHGEHRLACGLRGDWPRTTTAFSGSAPERIATSGAWTGPETFTCRLAFTETPFCPTLTCRFEGDRVEIDYRRNVSFQSEPLPPLIARAGTLRPT
jgi:CubicO group peptidase (beta-lactamase class C family)